MYSYNHYFTCCIRLSDALSIKYFYSCNSAQFFFFYYQHREPIAFNVLFTRHKATVFGWLQCDLRSSVECWLVWFIVTLSETDCMGVLQIRISVFVCQTPTTTASQDSIGLHSVTVIHCLLNLNYKNKQQIRLHTSLNGHTPSGTILYTMKILCRQRKPMQTSFTNEYDVGLQTV